MSQQMANLHTLGPVAVAQKVVVGGEGVCVCGGGWGGGAVQEHLALDA